MLNRKVTAYLELAELQALNQTPMYMKDWATKLDDFLKMTGKEILRNGGIISHQQAIQKATVQYAKFKAQMESQPSQVEKDFVKEIDGVEKQVKKQRPGSSC